MALSIDSIAPDFQLPSTSGKDFSLYADQKDRPCILYFYPRDFTRGCTKEACGFRDNIGFFSQFDIDVVGISRDPISMHLRFKKEYRLPFELLTDRDGHVAKMYDALIPVLGLTRRITYLLDKDQKITAVYEDFFGAKNHLEAMIAQVKSDTNT